MRGSLLRGSIRGGIICRRMLKNGDLSQVIGAKCKMVFITIIKSLVYESMIA
jgi:hypothetical protein